MPSKRKKGHDGVRINCEGSLQMPRSVKGKSYESRFENAYREKSWDIWAKRSTTDECIYSIATTGSEVEKSENRPSNPAAVVGGLDVVNGSRNHWKVFENANVLEHKEGGRSKNVKGIGAAIPCGNLQESHALTEEH